MVTIRNPIADFLGERACMILDGALATELERHGADLNDPLWSAKVLLEQPELIRAVHYDYFMAGADVATTASYQANFAAFAQRGIAAERVPQLLRESVALALAARDDFLSGSAPRLRPLVAASVGPYGAALADGSEYRGHYSLTDADLAQFHRPRLIALASAGPDLLAFETLPSLREALVLAHLLTEFPEYCAWVSFSCQDGTRTCEGQDIADCARTLNGFAQVAAIGVNCTSPEYVPSLLQSMRAHTDKPLLAYPNSGERYDSAAKRWHGHGTGRSFASHARAWFDAGARLIGGCCRTT
ncbi:MAG TPA: homocysteine S-methyltransferase, partial [Steroidobacteraceae bacterium]|nr:homocysteine S-methyltransferase [Steroidobacteraceae bacterium]